MLKVEKRLLSLLKEPFKTDGHVAASVALPDQPFPLLTLL
jgi:hypothetical protein